MSYPIVMIQKNNDSLRDRHCKNEAFDKSETSVNKL